jgi:hypothetical protein
MLMKWLIQIVLWQGVMAILLFVPAGTLNWTGAWIFLIETFVVSVVFGLWLGQGDEPVAEPRRRRKPCDLSDMKQHQKSCSRLNQHFAWTQGRLYSGVPGICWLAPN